VINDDLVLDFDVEAFASAFYGPKRKAGDPPHGISSLGDALAQAEIPMIRFLRVLKANRLHYVSEQVSSTLYSSVSVTIPLTETGLNQTRSLAGDMVKAIYIEPAIESAEASLRGSPCAARILNTALVHAAEEHSARYRPSKPSDSLAALDSDDKAQPH
jgi:hypothetical protein